jgi:hypothetical protein
MTEPIPVEIASPTPVPVEIINHPPPAPSAAAPSMRIQSQTGDPSVPARTTFQEDLVTAGQRRVNLIWEYTQAAIALLVVTMTMACGVIGMWQNIQIPTIISVAFGMITGFYFSRTNHEKVGGTGAKPARERYEGR